LENRLLRKRIFCGPRAQKFRFKKDRLRRDHSSRVRFPIRRIFESGKKGNEEQESWFMPPLL